jgi:hypothetical protein
MDPRAFSPANRYFSGDARGGHDRHRGPLSPAALLGSIGGAASQALGHSDLSTTASIYGHYELSDLERAMEALAKARRGEEEEPAESVFQSTGSESGLVEPNVEAAGIEPAQIQIERARFFGRLLTPSLQGSRRRWRRSATRP